jgi:hypothetical protein
MTISTPTAEWERAHRRAVQLRHFYIHVLAFVVGNLVAFFTNWLTLSPGAHPWWFQWGLLVWGSALTVHGLTLAGHGAFLGPRWEQRKISQYLREEMLEARARSERAAQTAGEERAAPAADRGD